ncbi:hypothetical protein MCC93_10290 [Morococcus cerebrosus]|uniref:Uncharacterized protein n=1 Tax=Morococcus cerebrosus TaxID=1056807 RepID=A0A0C1EB21_9NEIS|nr:hypothetical protein MCC93_10290 [Morococcus cerebrosus]
MDGRTCRLRSSENLVKRNACLKENFRQAFFIIKFSVNRK